MTKKITYKKIKTSIPEDVFVSHIDGIVGSVKNIILDGVFSNMKIYELEDTMFVLAYFTDATGNIPAIMIGARDDEFKSFVEGITIYHEYRVKGTVSLLDDAPDDIDLPFSTALKGKQVLCINAIHDLNSNKLFGIDVFRLYNCNLNKAYDLVSTNTDYLDDIPIDNVKTIEFSYYKDIIILLKNGSLLFNGKKKLNNIKTMIFLTGLSIFAVSYDNTIICVIGNRDSVKFLNNDNCKYKKILYSSLVIVALSYDNDIRLYGTITDQAIDYKRLVDVEDIGYVEDNDDIVVIKKGYPYSLFLEHDYTGEVPDVMVNGDFNGVFVIE